MPSKFHFLSPLFEINSISGQMRQSFRTSFTMYKLNISACLTDDRVCTIYKLAISDYRRLEHSLNVFLDAATATNGIGNMDDESGRKRLNSAWKFVKLPGNLLFGP